MSEPTKANDAPALSREESAFFIKALWEALLAPDWTRDHLIELGKVVFAKIPLNKLSEQQFSTLFPYLQKMASTIGTRLIQQSSSPQATAAPAAKPSQTEEKPHG